MEQTPPPPEYDFLKDLKDLGKAAIENVTIDRPAPDGWVVHAISDAAMVAWRTGARHKFIRGNRKRKEE